MMGPFSSRPREERAPGSGGANLFSMLGKLAVGCGALLVIGGIAVGVWIMSTHNDEVSLRNRILAQQDVCKADFDTMWKVIAQKAQIADRYRDSFRDIYPQLIAGRYGTDKGGVLLKWVQESNPQFDASLYKDVMASIEGQREGFFQNQKLLLDLKRQHDTKLQSWPDTLVVGGRAPVEIDLVLSAATGEAFRTGEENDVTVPGTPANKP